MYYIIPTSIARTAEFAFALGGASPVIKESRRFYAWTCFPRVTCFALLCFERYQEELFHARSWWCGPWNTKVALLTFVVFVDFGIFFCLSPESDRDGLSETACPPLPGTRRAVVACAYNTYTQICLWPPLLSVCYFGRAITASVPGVSCQGASGWTTVLHEILMLMNCVRG